MRPVALSLIFAALLLVAGAANATSAPPVVADDGLGNVQITIWDGVGDPSGIVDLVWLNSEDWVGFARTWTNTRWLPNNLPMPIHMALPRMTLGSFSGSAPSVPEPSAALLYCAGLALVSAAARRRHRSS